MGPLGKSFAVPEKSTSRLLVGGGIGIAPLLFLGQFHREKKITFMMGFRSAKDIISPQRITGEDAGFLVATDDGTKGHRGPVTDLLEEHLRENPGEVAVYACGPKPMLRKVAQMTMALRIPCQVSLEATHGLRPGRLSGVRGESVCRPQEKLLLCMQRRAGL